MADPEEFSLETTTAKGDRLLQKVIPETMQILVTANKDVIGAALAASLLSQNWTSVEVRGVPDLHDYNLYYTEGAVVDHNDTLDTIERQMRQLQEILGYSKEDLPTLNIILDPEKQGYNYAHAFINTGERNLWKKIHRGDDDLSHELGHWVTMGAIQDQGRASTLLKEGVATWLSARISNDPEKIMQDHLMVAKAFYPGALPEEFGIDSDIHNIPAMHVGAVFVESIIKELDGNTQKFGTMLKDADEHTTLSSWLESHGLDPKKIDEQLKKDIAPDNEPNKQDGWGKGLLKKIRGKQQ